jgi:hypothetical protein
MNGKTCLKIEVTRQLLLIVSESRSLDDDSKSQILEVGVTLRLTVSQSVRQCVLVSGTPLGPMTRFYFFLYFARKLLALSLGAPSLTRGRVCNL